MEMVSPAQTSMSVNLMVMKQNQDTTVTVRPIVQILWVVSCVNVEKVIVEMESLVEVSFRCKPHVSQKLKHCFC